MPKDIGSLLDRGKHYVCQYITAGCYESQTEKSLEETNLIEKHLCQHDHRRVHAVIDHLFDFRSQYPPEVFAEWIKYLICGRRLPNNFAKEVKLYDTTSKCGLVWTTNFVAYRCRTCAISLCMSVCIDCFSNGNHEGHDFNMFRSQAGGACDCGDSVVMRPEGFCTNHQAKNITNTIRPPNSLLCIAKEIIPRILHYLVLYLREDNFSSNRRAKTLLNDVLIYLNDLGTVMQSIICGALIDTELYQTSLNTINKEDDLEYQVRMRKLQENYRIAISKIDIATIFPSLQSKKISNLEIIKEIESFNFDLKHQSFLDEIIFWAIMNEFPPNLITFLLKMLPNEEYKIHFAKSFVKHYFRISMLILFPTNQFSSNRDNDIYHNKLANALVHISVQLFSNENLVLILAEQSQLLYVIIIALKFALTGNDIDFGGIVMPNEQLKARNEIAQISFAEQTSEPHVVRCDHSVLASHSFWPIMTDLNNLFTLKSISMIFMNDDVLINTWLEFIMAFQAMNINVKTADFEESNQPFQSSYLAELEICASQMWALIIHLNDENHKHIITKFVQYSLNWLETWLDKVDISFDRIDTQRCSFHLPLHRYYSVFMQHAVAAQGVPLGQLLPQESDKLKKLIYHPLQTMIVANHIMSNMWMNLGIQIKTQVYNYIQPYFCNSTIDADLFLIQQAASHLNPDSFIFYFFNGYGLTAPLSLIPTVNNITDKEKLSIFLENGLTFFVSILNIQINFGMSNAEISRKEMISLLSISVKTYSQLHNMLPFKYGYLAIDSFADILNDIADYHSPEVEINGNLAQGYFYPKNAIWENEYDPLFVLYRTSQRRDFQTSLERFATFAREAGKYNSNSLPWPPFRILPPVSNKFGNPHTLLNSKVLHAYLFSILFKSLQNSQWITQHLLSIVIYLMELTVHECSNQRVSTPIEIENFKTIPIVDQSKLHTWYETDDIIDNFFTTIAKVELLFENEAGDVNSSNKLAFFAYLLNSIRSEKSAEKSPEERCEDSPFASFENDEGVIDMSGATELLGSDSSRTFNMPLDSIIVNDDDSIDTQQSSSFIIESVKNIVISALNMISLNNLNCISEEFQAFTSLQNEIKAIDLKVTLKARPLRVQFDIDESILSLLLKLHSKLSNRKDSFKTSREHLNQYNFDSRIGDGPYFIGCLLKKFILSCTKRLDPVNSFETNLSKVLSVVDQYRRKIWPEKASEPPTSKEKADCDRPMDTDDIEDKEVAERKRKALERKQQILNKFSSLQDAFMKSNKINFENEDASMDSVQSNAEAESDENMPYDKMSTNMENIPSKYKPKMYQCVICGDSGYSTLERCFVQAVLLQSTSVLGNVTAHSLFDEGSENPLPSNQPSSSRSTTEASVHHLPPTYRIPTSDEESGHFSQRLTFADYFEHRVDNCSNLFGAESWLSSVNIGWCGGVHAQSCGHLMHMDCYQSYISTIFKNRNGPELLDYGCPLCRKVANSVLPIIPNFANLYALVKCRNNDPREVATEIFDLLSNGDQARLANTTEEESKFLKKLAMSIEDVLKATEPEYRNIRVEPCSQSLFLFLSSIARINLECIVVLWIRNFSITPNTTCFVHLLHALSLNGKLVISEEYTRMWSQITGIDSENIGAHLTPYEKQVPLLVKDVSALLLQLLFALPLNIDKAYFVSIVQALLNLSFVQALVLCIFRMSDEQKAEIKAKYQQLIEKEFNGCFDYIGFILAKFDSTHEQQPLALNAENRKRLSTENILESVAKLCLPLLRISTMLSHLLFNHPGLPSYKDQFPQNVFDEFRTLANHLNLNTSTFSKAIITGKMDDSFYKCFINWMDNPATLITTWYSELDKFTQSNVIASVKLLKYSFAIAHQPCLLDLPPIYEQLFMYYLKKTCVMCNNVPKEPSICLVCGRLVCIKGSCCRTGTTHEGVSHAKKCGAGTTIYLAVNSTTIIVIRGRKACVWGSVYLDEYGEEDRDLKRGKPLFLCEERYRVLEQQWLTHSFSNTYKKWIYHKDSL